MSEKPQEDLRVAADEIPVELTEQLVAVVAANDAEDGCYFRIGKSLVQVSESSSDRRRRKRVDLLDVPAESDLEAKRVKPLVGDIAGFCADNGQRAGGRDDPHHRARLKLGRYQHIHVPRVTERTGQPVATLDRACAGTG